MIQVTFILRTLTPLFLAGADQTKAELRAPTFRGLMRYWHRALVGGIVGTDAKGLKAVSEQEAKVFGATDSGSAVAIRVSEASHKPREFTEQISKRVEGIWQATGRGYLLWSMARSGSVEKKNLKPARWYFPEGTSFHVTVSAHDQDSTALKQAVAAFWLLVHLGGVGSRSRRCAGSLIAQPVENGIPGLSFDEPASIEELQKHLQQGIETVRKLYAVNPVSSINNASFDILSRNVCRIWILHNNGEPWHRAYDAMSALASGLQASRQSIVSLWKRQIFGLPLRNVSQDRRASPLLLRVTKLQGEQYVGIAVLFKTTEKGMPSDDYKLIEDGMDKFPGKREVKL